jgi:AraC-like DNA-binding protein
VPDQAVAHLDALVLALADETRRPVASRSVDVQRHQLCTLLWVERWHDTKELITDRRMLEAARLLRFTDRSMGEVASRAGFDDQLYFSRSFKRYYGRPPTGYREPSRVDDRERRFSIDRRRSPVSTASWRGKSRGCVVRGPWLTPR